MPAFRSRLDFLRAHLNLNLKSFGKSGSTDFVVFPSIHLPTILMHKWCFKLGWLRYHCNITWFMIEKLSTYVASINTEIYTMRIRYVHLVRRSGVFSKLSSVLLFLLWDWGRKSFFGNMYEFVIICQIYFIPIIWVHKVWGTYLDTQGQEEDVPVRHPGTWEGGFLGRWHTGCLRANAAQLGLTMVSYTWVTFSYANLTSVQWDNYSLQ